MTGPKEPVIFGPSVTLNIEGSGKKKTFRSSSKIEQTAKTLFACRRLPMKLQRFQGARPDHVLVESSSRCFHGG